MRCHHCKADMEDTAAHTLSDYPAWTVKKRSLADVREGIELFHHSLIGEMVGSKKVWKRPPSSATL